MTLTVTEDAALANLPQLVTPEQAAQLAAGFNEMGRQLVAWFDQLATAWAAALAPVAEQLAAVAPHPDAMRWQPGDWTGP